MAAITSTLMSIRSEALLARLTDQTICVTCLMMLAMMARKKMQLLIVYCCDCGYEKKKKGSGGSRMSTGMGLDRASEMLDRDTVTVKLMLLVPIALLVEMTIQPEVPMMTV